MRLFIFFLLFNGFLFAQDYGAKSAPAGLETGSEAPLFKTVDHEGNVLDFEKLIREGPLVVIFYRGQWCPVCNRYLQSFQDSLKVLQKAGARVVAVSPETVPNVRKTIFNTQLTLPVIADTTREIMDAYRVSFDVTDDYSEKIKRNLKTDIAENNGAETAVLPVPATYIIGSDGRIAWRQFDLNYKSRASVKQIAEQVRELEAGK